MQSDTACQTTVAGAARLLDKAVALISTPESWTKLTWARDAAYDACGLDAGVRFCAIGALCRARIDTDAPADTLQFAKHLLAVAVANRTGDDGDTVQNWNDDAATCHADVMAVYAAARAQAAPRRQTE